MPLEEIKFTEKDVRKLFWNETWLTKLGRSAKRITLSLVSLLILYAIFFTAINYNAFWTRFQFSLKDKPTNQPVAIVKSEPEPQPVIIYPSQVIIPKIGVTAPLHVNVLPSQIIPTLQSGVTHYADTALPGENGNTVIFGHSSDLPWSPGAYKNIFALLDKLVVGDRITVPYTTQQFVYEVTGSRVVRPTELSVLKKTLTPQLTLITCYPVGTAQKRLVVTARLVEGTVTGDQMTEPVTQELPKIR